MLWIMITADTIQYWLTAPENKSLEFKEAAHTYEKEKLYKYCVAIANEGGGHFVLGIVDKIPRFVSGTSCFANISNIELDIYSTLHFKVEVEEYMHNDKRVLCFCIPPRPRGIPLAYNGQYFMRVGESLVHMSYDALKKIMDENKQAWLEETARDNVDEQEFYNLLDIDAFFRLLRKPRGTTFDAIVLQLEPLGLVKRTSTGINILNMGALLISRDINDFASVKRKAVRILVYEGTNKLKTKSDFRPTSGYLLSFKEVVQHVINLLPQSETITNITREEIRDLPTDVIRELLANALIHQDLTITGMSPTIEIYADRLEIANAGLPLVGIVHFIDGNQSRNEGLTDVFRLIGYCEEKGSGIDRVIANAEQLHLLAPDFRADANRTIVVLGWQKQFLEMTLDDRLRACYQHCVLQYVTNNRMTNQSLRARFGLGDGHASAVSQLIAQAVDQKLIKHSKAFNNSKKFADYIPGWA